MVNGISYELQSIYGMDHNDKKKEVKPPLTGTAIMPVKRRFCINSIQYSEINTYYPFKQLHLTKLKSSSNYKRQSRLFLLYYDPSVAMYVRKLPLLFTCNLDVRAVSLSQASVFNN